jgi:hypothetical protein
MKEFLIENWIPLIIALMAFAKVVVNLTPTESDNQVFGIIDTIINALIPNRKKKPNKDF